MVEPLKIQLNKMFKFVFVCNFSELYADTPSPTVHLTPDWVPLEFLIYSNLNPVLF